MNKKLIVIKIQFFKDNQSYYRYVFYIICKVEKQHCKLTNKYVHLDAISDCFLKVLPNVLRVKDVNVEEVVKSLLKGCRIENVSHDNRKL